MNTRTFFQAVEHRRSHYDIRKESPIADEEIRQIVEKAMLTVPSAFNGQTARTLLLFGKEHDALWDIVEDTLRAVVPAESFAATQQKIASFRNGYGTVVFFEDQEVIEGFQREFALYKDNFPVWSLQASGMLQFVIWTALEDAGLGASLQHYNPLIDEAVKARWNIPAHWKLWAQMPFGTPQSNPGPKDVLPLESRLIVAGE